MKAIILAAGKGERMGFETNDKPKCMVSFNGRPIIDYILETLKACGIEDIIIVNGYKNNVLEAYLFDKNIRFITNTDFDSTNMVYTLFCAESEMNDDLLISYADIIYKKEVLQGLLNNDNEFVVTVDKNWKEIWRLRMNDPLKDAETMKIDDIGNIIELGKQPISYNQIEGQYIGLCKISNSVMGSIRKFYHKLDKTILYDGKDYYNMYMTSFIQLIIENLLPVRADIINGGWLEFDSEKDINCYKRNKLLIDN